MLSFLMLVLHLEQMTLIDTHKHLVPKAPDVLEAESCSILIPLSISLEYCWLLEYS